MNEDEKYWEQPEDLVLDDETNNGSQQGEQSAIVGEESEAENGEKVGKFKNVEALLDAYNNLEKEFTKKSQRLAEFEKDKMEEEKELESQVDNKLKTFLSSNGEANSYSEELKKRVLENESLKKMDDPFSYVWAEMIFEKLKGSSETDGEVANYVLGNEKLKNIVLEKYVNQLTENKSPIKISSAGKRVATSTATQKPQNLKDAKDYLKNLFS